MAEQTGRNPGGHASPSWSAGGLLADSHVHLQSPEFAADLDAVLERARAAGVRRFLCPGYDLASSRAAVDLASQSPGVVAAVGVHPNDERHYDDGAEVELEEWLAAGRAVAAGEMGLDYHYDHSPRDLQREALRRQLRLARRLGVPVVLHNRESDDDMARILAEEAGGVRGVLHAFTGSPQLVELGCRLGLFFGIGGFLTFRNHPLAGCVRDLPRDALLLETDAPYLSPHPQRGSRNEPARVAVVASRLAEILHTSVEDVAACTTANFERFLDEA